MVVPDPAPSGPAPVPTRPRRRPVLLALAATTVAAPLAGLLAGCGKGDEDPLNLLLRQARAEVEAYEALLADPEVREKLAPKLDPIVEARRQHAQALGVELGETTPPSPKPQPPAPKREVETVIRLVRATLDQAREQAANLVPTLPRARAGLVGSIAANCAAHSAVLAA
ncbi:hypothetical protein BKA01_007009 [Pseudonocardia eucalypti]|uniref:hypothetical protein n=1 Tax=Pseudonocardia eucalypti TaxID=648755 RepID=UPI00161D64E1|nr:hypothetical protein [Pseudonocardia eucalypti]